MNTNKNSYIIIYSAVMVIIVAFLLAFIFQALKPMQDVNVALDKKKQILASLNIRDLANNEAEAKYGEVVKKEVTIGDGLMLYDCQVDGKQKYVVPVRGMGLWGPIWGYVALDEDKNTVYGAYFNHESETAGLGAEIKDSRAWQDQFRGKKVFAADGETVAIAVKKKADVKNPESECDAVTGATLTSDGVSLMLQESFAKYKSFLKK
ncbi:MAG: NADH:ubiquinone reductase (Na(+)-transporting) subunit C [Prevotellaceae bacterium]|nr:NADH:ubiquinone reductase (Na(+)-transporting) subunit C [Prevotellaceae bacterium]MDD5991823.1 NADH:ubiquinone reductase (Na(+)-transporting) subunit C [Prevotellaceae bacterium]MDD6008935.1 NADH:ubiquinone reductase (Na(+)-transporting) subunit C [Prevotellaceae bacterium]MDD6111356.1 NADH:ubiquinone reductase (Na(+)-transporting) subunit C [Prevotellaceae bacterium]MDD6779796.1 NADH:ubiquinone reductase (Na(+)-transporting) subunit C [Prevotellaceae bacterium]